MRAIDLNNLKVFRGKLVDYRRKSSAANGKVMFNDMFRHGQRRTFTTEYELITTTTILHEKLDQSCQHWEQYSEPIVISETTHYGTRVLKLKWEE